MPPPDDIVLRVMAAMGYISYSLLAYLPLSPDFYVPLRPSTPLETAGDRFPGNGLAPLRPDEKAWKRPGL